MNKIKVIKIAIAITITIIMIMIFSIILVNTTNNSVSTYEYDENVEQETQEYTINRKVEKVTEVNYYFIVKNIIDQYYSTCQAIDKVEDTDAYMNEGQEQDKEKNAQQTLYNMLDMSYLSEFNITQEDIQHKFGITNKVKTILEKIYVLQNSSNVSTYFITGILIDTENQKISDFNIAVSLDILNKTFSIYPQEYLEKYNYDELNLNDNLEINIESIENRNDNTFKYKFIEDEVISREYLLNYKYNMLYNVEYAYELLDTEYREKRFSSIEDFKKYIEENKEAIEKAVLSGYSVDYGETITKYVLEDTYNNYFILQEDAIMDYTIKLDSYTIPESDFNTEYSKLKDAEKASANIGIFMQMINTKDYNHAYEKLSDGFKTNHFNTLEEFKNYIQSNFYYVNDYTIDNYKNEGNIYIYHITLKNYNKVRDDTNIQKTFNIRLGEGTDFEISFNVN